MSQTHLNCPHCGHAIALSEALAAQIRGELEAALAVEQQQRRAQAVARAREDASAPLREQLAALEAQAQSQARLAHAAQERELALQRRAIELEAAQREGLQRMRLELESRLRAEADERAQALADAAARNAREAAALELRQAHLQLTEQRARLAQAEQAELALRAQADRLEARARTQDLEVARQLEARRSEWEAGLRQSLDEEQALKLREKQKQIDDMRRVIDDLRRKSQQGSPERQGEVLELDIEAALAARFPRDRVRPVPKGAQGADLIHEVRDAALASCGSIVWEFKHTRHWQAAWLAKLRDDQRACGANVAVLVSVALPEAVQSGFALIDGVWVCGLAAWPALATALREQLQQIAFARNAATGMNDKMESLYHYLSGDAFRHKVEAIVEAFGAMHGDLARERRAMEKLWKERERQLERIITSTAGMYGELRGTIGAAMAPIAALELDAEDVAPAQAERAVLASLPSAVT
jgi:hypothetical protein